MTRLSLASGLATLVAMGGVAMPAVAQDLPNPYVSRALDAVLLPVDGAVIDAFGLHPDDYGALVLATEPGGTADQAGIWPGDVISVVRGKPVYDPVEIDSVVWYWISQGVTDFGWEYYRGGEYYVADWVISEDDFWMLIDIAAAGGWTSWEYADWSYSAYYSEYSEVMIEEYSYSETWIEETVSSEEFVSEVESYSEETMTEEEMTNAELEREALEEAEGGMTEEEMTNAELEREALEEEAAAADEGMADDAMAAEEAVEEEMVEEQPAEEEFVEEEPVEEEPVEEDFGGDDGGGDEGVEE